MWLHKLSSSWLMVSWTNQGAWVHTSWAQPALVYVGQWAVQDCPGWFCAVGGDMKVKQTIQQVWKGPGGHYVIWATHNVNAAAEFEFFFHEIVIITDVFNFLTNNHTLKQKRMPSPACTEHHSPPYIQPKFFKAAGLCARLAESILGEQIVQWNRHIEYH